MTTLAPAATEAHTPAQLIQGWDHLELWVGNARAAAGFLASAFGFTVTAYAGPETGVKIGRASCRERV